jgi:kumamolisin
MAIRNRFGGYVTLSGSHRLPLPGSRNAGPVDHAQLTRVSVRVRSKGNLADLGKELEEIYRSPLRERAYLSRQSVAERFGAAPEDLAAIEQLAQRHDLRVIGRSGPQRTVMLTGQLGDLLKAFPADLQQYHHPLGAYRGRQGPILVPAGLENVITGIFGFDTRPKRRAGRGLRDRLALAAGPGGSVPSSAFAQRYSFPQSSGSTNLDGTGQCIGIIELGGGYTNTDLQTYFSEIGSPLPNVVQFSADGSTNQPSGDPNSADGEVMLDIEVAGAVAPAAQIVVYFGPNQGNGFYDVVNAAVHDTEHNPSVLSISWGESEDYLEDQARQAFSELFMEAASMGITVCAATGDHGTANATADQWDNQIHVNHPSSDPYVLACGGTQIVNGQDVVWNDGTTLAQGGWATGGGISIKFPVPSYQNGIQMPNSLQSGTPGRGLPDISGSATDYYVRVDSGEGASGGTSAVTPLIASLVVLLNQATGKPLGFLNPFLYAHGTNGITTDVVSGTNAIAQTVAGYQAGPGWDPCTGWGTPIGTAILSAL